VKLSNGEVFSFVVGIDLLDVETRVDDVDCMRVLAELDAEDMKSIVFKTKAK
jgi:hypothetical protein